MNKKLSLAVLTTGLALAVAAPATAADPVRGGSPSTGENVVTGAGRGTAQADVDGATGAMSLASTATGGQNVLSPLGVAFLGGPTSAGASGTVGQDLGEVGPGRYLVQVTFADTEVDASTRGTGTTSEQTAVFVSLRCDEGCEEVAEPPAGRFDALPAGGGDVTRTVAVVVPEGASAALAATISVSATSSAWKRGNSAASAVEVGSITTVVAPG